MTKKSAAIFKESALIEVVVPKAVGLLKKCSDYIVVSVLTYVVLKASGSC